MYAYNEAFFVNNLDVEIQVDRGQWDSLTSYNGKTVSLLLTLKLASSPDAMHKTIFLLHFL